MKLASSHHLLAPHDGGKTGQSRRTWLTVAGAASLTPIIGLLVVDTHNTESQFRLAGTIAGYVMYLSLVCAAVLFVAIFKLSGKNRILPIVGFVLALAATGAAYFTHWFNV